MLPPDLELSSAPCTIGPQVCTCNAARGIDNVASLGEENNRPAVEEDGLEYCQSTLLPLEEFRVPGAAQPSGAHMQEEGDR
ncbi:hypothetical protein CHS0354_006989 [Potamilus streckersoni]|uniref:Uncharacterized protein n=1 Tax=Potamilus streckersoni TaxID=2493646 RepID=A0AAE0RWI0_9BIVA|nr:hypothetical protein CHS0354_006989 [Potamilus streckersoni]